jgi:hypothetical protein
MRWPPRFDYGGDTITAGEGAVHETTTVSSGAASAATSSVAAAPATVAANGVATTTVTVTVEDAEGNLVPDAAVTLASTGTGDVFGATTGRYSRERCAGAPISNMPAELLKSRWLQVAIGPHAA